MVFFKKYWKSVFWVCFVCYLLLTPSSNLPKNKIIDFEHFDKVIHLSMFCIMMLLMSTDIIRNTTLKIWLALSISLAFAIFIALTTEFVQYKFVADRQGDIYDLYANFTGMGVACILLLCAFRYNIFGSYLKR